MNTLLLMFAICASLVMGQVDECQTNSYATGAVTQISSLSPSLFSNINSAAGINSALSSLFDIVIKSSSPFMQNVYVGQSGTNDFYMIKNCANQQGPNDYCSSNGPQYIAYVRNTAYFGDNVRHVFGVVGGAVSVTANAYTSETTEYVTSTRNWFSVNGWTVLITYAAGGQGKAFVKPFGTGLVAAADRPMTEYCGACMSNSNAVPIAQALAVANWNSVYSIDTVEGFSIVGKIIKAAVDIVKSEYTINSNIGLDNGDSYMFKNCNHKDQSDECKGHDYLLYVVNQAVYGNSIRRVFSLNADGSIKELVATLGSYVVTDREWYTVRNGWSDPYSFASTSTIGRTYAIGINGGVVGSGRLNDEPCNTSAEGCITSSAGSIVSSFLLLAIGVAVLF